jgi:hypothetical protein
MRTTSSKHEKDDKSIDLQDFSWQTSKEQTPLERLIFRPEVYQNIMILKDIGH